MKEMRNLNKGKNALLAFVCGVLLFAACSQENEYGPQLSPAEAKQAEVVKLTEKYGLHLNVLKGMSEEEIAALDLKEVESCLKAIKELTSKPHPIKLVKEGLASTIKPVQNRRLKTRSEGGSWQGTATAFDPTITLGVSVSWYTYNPNGAVMHGKVESKLEYAYDYNAEYKQTEYNVNFSWEDVIEFSFKGDLDIYRFSYTVTGTGSIHSGHGSVWIDVKPK